MEKIVFWKEIKNFRHYEVSTDGRVRRGSKELKPTCNNKGYPKVTLLKKGKRKQFYVHRLVAWAFVSNPDNLTQVNHKDGNKLNNNSSNLEWVNNRSNTSRFNKTNTTSKYTGVSFKKRLQQMAITNKGKREKRTPRLFY